MRARRKPSPLAPAEAPAWPATPTELWIVECLAWTYGEEGENEMFALLQSGRLKALAIDDVGNTEEEIGASVWKGRAALDVMETGKLRFCDGQVGSGCPEKWVYLTRASLETHLPVAIPEPNSRPAPRRSSSPGYRSPYLQFMLEMSERLQLSPENQSNHVAIIKELQAAWEGEPPLSERLAKAMATLLREPKSQLGRAAKNERA